MTNRSKATQSSASIVPPVAMLALFACITAAVVAGCSLFGASPKAPTGTERGLYDVITNYVTNSITATNIQTKTVEVPVFTTNEQNKIVWSTNTVQEKITNFTTVPVTNETYTLTPKQSTKDSVAAVGTLTNTFFPGIGGLVSTALAGGLALWGHLRSYKRGSALGAMTQEVETTREFIKALPNGEHYDDAIITWIQAHQAELGVAKVVEPIVDRNVNNPEAKVAAQQLIDLINAVMAQKRQEVIPTTSPLGVNANAPIGAVKLS